MSHRGFPNKIASDATISVNSNLFSGDYIQSITYKREFQIFHGTQNALYIWQLINADIRFANSLSIHCQFTADSAWRRLSFWTFTRTDIVYYLFYLFLLWCLCVDETKYKWPNICMKTSGQRWPIFSENNNYFLEWLFILFILFIYF